MLHLSGEVGGQRPAFGQAGQVALGDATGAAFAT